MVAILLPLLALGALAFAVGRHGARDELAVAGEAAPPPASTGSPSPLMVLDGFLRAGQVPPPPVILCAIAEAEVLGRVDVALAIVEAFIVPVVARAHMGHPPVPPSAPTQPSAPWFPEGDAARGGSPPPTSAADSPRPPWLHHPHHGHHGHREHRGHHGGPAPASPTGAPAATPTMPGSPYPSIADPAYSRVEIIPPPAAPPSAPASPPARGPMAGTLTVSGRSSPIEGIATEDWANFVGRISRELPTFSTPRHVGQYRQRRERLAELGIDPASIVGSPDAQHDALDADMVDAWHHADESGLIAEYRGVCLEIPPPGQGQEPRPVTVTTSGVLGLIQAAGLEGAVQWLQEPQDRRRFPGTTAAFLRTNGVF